MTFKEARAGISQTVFGKTGHFAGQYRYRPGGGGPARTVKGTAVREKWADELTGGGEEERDRIWFQCAKDPSGDRGGIDRPELGDSLLGPDDSADNPWTFQGEIRNEADSWWELLFARNRPRRYGPLTPDP